jgi:hypothetical protein
MSTLIEMKTHNKDEGEEFVKTLVPVDPMREEKGKGSVKSIKQFESSAVDLIQHPLSRKPTPYHPKRTPTQAD